MPTKSIIVNTFGEGFVDITKQITQESHDLIKGADGVLFLFSMHTSCGLTLNESYDPSAKEDMENFLKYLAPRNLKFIKHDAEGEDDSPSHMKTILTGQHIALPVDEGEISIGTWQGIYLCEFRDGHKNRSIKLKFIKS